MRLKKFFRKIKKSAGYSLSELLIATMILLLASSGMVAGVALAQKEYVKSVREAESVELYSTLKTIISNELRYSKEISIDNPNATSNTNTESGNVTAFFSKTYALEQSLSYVQSKDENGNLMIDENVETKCGYGRIYFGSVNGNEGNPILGKASYSSGLSARIEKISYNNQTHYFYVTLSIGFGNGSIYTSSFEVLNVNETIAKYHVY